MMINKGFLSKSQYLSYQINIPIIPSTVRRADEDFDELQEYLIKAYPNVIVPTTKSFNAKKINEQKYMTKRGGILSTFLKNALRSRTLRGDKFLLNFLCETDNKKYIDEKKQMKNFKKIETIDHLVTSSGKIELTQVEVEQIQEILNKRVKRASDQTEQGYVYLHQQIRKMGQDLKAASQAAENIKDTFNSLLNVSYDLQTDS